MEMQRRLGNAEVISLRYSVLLSQKMAAPGRRGNAEDRFCSSAVASRRQGGRMAAPCNDAATPKKPHFSVRHSQQHN